MRSRREPLTWDPLAADSNAPLELEAARAKLISKAPPPRSSLAGTDYIPRPFRMGLPADWWRQEMVDQ